MVIYDFFEDLRPWPEEGEERLRHWMEEVFRGHAHLLSDIAEVLAQQLREQQQPQEALTLAAAFLHAVGARGQQGLPNVRDIVLPAAVARLPLTSLDMSWQQLCSNADGAGWSSDVAAR